MCLSVNIVLVLCILFSSSRAVIINQAREGENAKDFYERVKKFSVQDVAQVAQEPVDFFLSSNPLLNNLPMFSKEHSSNSNLQESMKKHTELKVFAKPQKTRERGDNFSEKYDSLNHTLFNVLDYNEEYPDIRLAPTGRILSDKSIMDTRQDEEMTTKEPFTVTENLINFLESAIDPYETSTFPSKMSTDTMANLENPETFTRPAVGSSSDFSNPRPKSESDLNTSGKMGLAESQFLGQNYMKLEPTSINKMLSDRIDENRIKNSQTKGHIEVWGTKYYEDNRIEGEIQSGHILQQGDSTHNKLANPFAIEVELMKMKNEEQEGTTDTTKPQLFGSKILSDGNKLDFGEWAVSSPDIELKTETKVLQKDGKTVERRISHVKDREVTVTLSNPLLFGHDYLLHPGSIIQPEPLNYKPTIANIKTNRQRAKAFAALSNPYGTEGSLNNAHENKFKPSTTVLPQIPSLKGECGQGTAPLFVRSSDVEETVGIGRTVVIQSSEDDCVSACLTNKVDDRLPFDCVSASYRKHTRDCQLTSDITRHLLRPRGGSIYYEKTCVDASVADACSGGIVVRKEQMVIIGYIRDAYATESVEECIALCISAETSAGYRCLSFVYYFEENLNCILNDASHFTAPNAIVKENMTEVDYFAVDQCYGIAYAADYPHTPSTKIQNVHHIEDDVKVGEITSGSMIRPLRKLH